MHPWLAVVAMRIRKIKMRPTNARRGGSPGMRILDIYSGFELQPRDQPAIPGDALIAAGSISQPPWGSTVPNAVRKPTRHQRLETAAAALKTRFAAGGFKGPVRRGLEAGTVMRNAGIVIIYAKAYPVCRMNHAIHALGRFNRA